MAEKTEELLDRLAEMQAQLTVMRLRYRDMRKSVIPQEVQEKLDEIDAEEKTALEAANTGIDILTAQIKEAVLRERSGAVGKHLRALWMKGRVTWDTKALEGYAAGHPEIRHFRKEGEPTVSIRSA